MKEFQGTIIHSHNYRDPEAFRGKTVACLGAGSSGQDITLDVARCAKQVLRTPTITDVKVEMYNS